MDRHTLENWKKIKELMEQQGRTDTFFYKRAVAILAGKKDPLQFAGGSGPSADPNAPAEPAE